MHSKALIAQTNVQCALFFELLRTGEAPQAEAVVDRNTNDWLANGNRLVDDERKIVALISAATVQIRPAMNPKGDWELLVLVSCRSYNVEIETVL
jgi:hypothetical protein